MRGRRHPPALACAVAALLAACAPLRPAPHLAPPAIAQAPPEALRGLRLIGTAALPHAMEFLGTTVGGISGIDHDPVQNQWVLLSDDRSALQPARFYTARLHYREDALEPPTLTGVLTLRQPDGQPFPSPREARRAGQACAEVPDPEAVRWLPGGRSLLWTSEGDFARGFAPALRENGADGAAVRQFALPSGFTPQPGKRGPRGNQSLEGLALSPDGRTAWIAMEAAWHQDGPVPTLQTPGGPLRITALDIASGQALRQIAYVPDAVPRARRLPWGPQLNGVSEILADGPDHLLVLERAYSAGAGFSARLYRIGTLAASDTLALDRLEPGNHVPAAKALVAEFPAPGLPAVDNLEGMAWGPPLPGGRRVIVFVSDDNFNPAQTTQFIAAEYLEPRGPP
ncbi:esterase-like activity of phytase family protein [Acidovorax sp. GBBC 3334]|uniref:esterase-like activity of phytase family protein n=1 Tax=Acidovorax sp. GBBC 3334 TaxID=2940496 RepID=UPI003FA43F41